MVTVSALANLLTRLSSSLARAARPYYQLRLQMLKVAGLHRTRGLAGQGLKVRQPQFPPSRQTSPQPPREPLALQASSLAETPAEDRVAPSSLFPEAILPALVLQETLARRLKEVQANAITGVTATPRESLPRLQTLPIRGFEAARQPAEIPPSRSRDAIMTPGLPARSAEPRVASSDPNMRAQDHRSWPPQVTRMIPSLAGFVPMFPSLPLLIFPRRASGQDQDASPLLVSNRSTNMLGPAASIENHPEEETTPVGLSLAKLQHSRTVTMKQLGLASTSLVAGGEMTVTRQTPVRPRTPAPASRQTFWEGPKLPFQENQSKPKESPVAQAEHLEESEGAEVRVPTLRTRKIAMTLALARYYSTLGLPLTRVLTEPSARPPLLSISHGKTSLHIQPGTPAAPSGLDNTSRNLNQLVTTYAEVESSQTRLQLLGTPASPQHPRRVTLPSIQVGSATNHIPTGPAGRTFPVSPTSTSRPTLLELPRVELPEISVEDRLPILSEQGHDLGDTDELRQKIAKILVEEARRYLGNE